MINQIYYSYNAVPADYDVIFVTNPTFLHFEAIQQLAGKTKHMFIEKPVFNRTDINLETLGLKTDGIYYVACPLRYTDVIQFIKNEIDLNSVLRWSYVQAICRSGTDQDYRYTYSAHKEQGGGVSIDLIHEWDYYVICLATQRR